MAQSDVKREQVKVAAVILAAGRSLRMGRPKLLLPWGAETILARTIRHVRASLAEEVLLVSGAYRPAVEAIASAGGVPAVHNPDFAEGEILSSLQVAVEELERMTGPEGVLVMLGDLPFIPTALLDEVLNAFRGLPEPAKRIVAPVFNGRRGHPVCIGRAFFPSLLALPRGGQPRDLLRAQAASIIELPVTSDAILRDIDTPEEYERWRSGNSEQRTADS